MDGLNERLLLWVLCTALLVWYILRYAAKVKKDPTVSWVYKIDGDIKSPFAAAISHETNTPEFKWKDKILLFVYIATFIIMIAGVVFLKWWTLKCQPYFWPPPF
jgi:uncharacterized ion transporter superfamily protein YfcC